MNKIILIIFLSIIAPHSRGAIAIDRLTNFREDLKKYIPNAPWIVDQFIYMDLKSFGIAFKETIDILTDPQKRWFYFCNKPESFNPDNYWDQCLWQCSIFEKWVNDVTLIKEKDIEELVYKSQSRIKNTMNFIQILKLIEKDKREPDLVNKYYQFFAFFSDCYSIVFCDAIYACYNTLDNREQYKAFLDVAQKALKKLKKNLIELKESNFYLSYKKTLDNYKNILSLLEEERLKKIVR